jgi:hypothetical protein
MPSCVFCPVCGDVIGVHEPLIVVGTGSVRRTSLAMEPALGSGDEVITHAGCESDLGERSRTLYAAGSPR